MALTAPHSSTPSSAAATGSEGRPASSPAQSLRWRIALSYAGLLVVAAGVLLFFVNAAARLATLPIRTVTVPDPVSGFSFTQRYVDSRVAAAQQDTLDRLRFYSLLAFAVVVLGGLVVGWVVSGRALRPISRIATVARNISERNLDERIGLVGPDDELKQLADSFDAMVERLGAAFDRERQLVADASHELRTPLTSLQLTLEGVRGDPEATGEDLRRVVDQAAAAASRMRRLVEDMLTLSETGPPPPAVPIALGPLAEAVVEELLPVASSRGVHVATGLPAGTVGIAEPAGLRRALRNLVENGVRYTPPGGTVEIQAAPAPAGFVGIAVRDTGIGIPPELREKVFDRFFRADRGRSRADGGSGLGLSIVAKVMRDCGGAVHVESAPGHGSRFTILVPAAPRPPAQPPAPAPPGTPPAWAPPTGEGSPAQLPGV